MMNQYAEGVLPASLSMAISAHLELCDCCKKQFKDIEASQSQVIFDNDSSNEIEDELLQMLNGITSNTDIDEVLIKRPEKIVYQGKKVSLPRVLSGLERTSFSKVGKLSRSRFALDDGELRMSLLQIEAGGQIPNHTHTGFELTLLLDGEFEDESGKYEAGDFIWLDGRHTHTPYTEHGCLCFTLVNSALHFNKGLSQLLNPIGNLIY